MEQEKLAQQISQRASSVSRLSGMMEASQDSYFEGWKSKADGLYSQQLSKYQNVMEGVLQEKTEGVALLADAPVFFKLGQVGYEYAPAVVQGGFDSIAESSAWGMASEAAESAVAAGRGAVASMSAAGSELGSRIAATLSGESAVAETEMIGGEVEAFTSQIAGTAATTTLDDALLGGTSATAVSAYETGGAAAAEEAGEIAGGVEVGAEAGVEAAEVGALSGEAALAETGVGMPVAGVLAAATAIGFGLYDLFAPHHHDAPALSKPPPPLQNRYTIASSILPSTQAAVSGGQAMVF